MRSICFVVTSLDSGGVENYLLRFLRFKSNEFKEIVVFCKSGRGGQLEEEYLKISNVTIKKWKIGFFDIINFLKIRAYFKSKRFDSICDFSGNFAGIYMFLAKNAGIINRITFYRESREQFHKTFTKNLYSEFVKSMVFKYSSLILSNSQDAINYFFKGYCIDDRFIVIRNGIDDKKFVVKNENLRIDLKYTKDDIIIGHVGRFTDAKNHLFILDVAKTLIKRNMNIRFLLCGHNVFNELSSVVKMMGLEKNFILFENRNDVPDVLNVIDLFFFPSLSEGQPNALIEAMILEKPFISSDIECIRECVPEFCYTNLIDPRNVEEASTKIMNVINNLELYEKSRVKAWAEEKFNAERQFNEFFLKL